MVPSSAARATIVPGSIQLSAWRVSGISLSMMKMNDWYISPPAWDRAN
jgi:hypothetical protein